MTAILERITTQIKDRRAARWKAFVALAADVLDGADGVTPDRVEQVLAGVGKTMGDLEQMTEQVRQLRRLRVDADGAEDARDELAAVEKEVGAARSEVEAAQRKLGAVVAKTQPRKFQAEAALAAGRAASAELAQSALCVDPEVLAEARQAVQSAEASLREAREAFRRRWGAGASADRVGDHLAAAVLAAQAAVTDAEAALAALVGEAAEAVG